VGLELRIADVPAEHVLTVTTVTSQERIGADLQRLYPSLFAAGAAGAPVCIYPEAYDPERIVVVAGVPFTGTAPYGFDELDLPAGRALVSTYVGSHDGLAAAWREAFDYLERQELQVGAAPYERYRGGETDIVIPLR
jgi:effector-binding domain-containing protein